MLWVPLLLLGVGVGQMVADPCLLSPATVYRVKASQLQQIAVGFCWDGLDTNGLPVNGTVGFKLDIDGVGTIDLGPLQPLTAPNANGDSYYESAPGLIPQGGSMHLHTYATAGESAGSRAFLVTVLGNPKPPKNGVLIIR